MTPGNDHHSNGNKGIIGIKRIRSFGIRKCKQYTLRMTSHTSYNHRYKLLLPVKTADTF